MSGPGLLSRRSVGSKFQAILVGTTLSQGAAMIVKKGDDGLFEFHLPHNRNLRAIKPLISFQSSIDLE